jgi:hypothetical protein
MMSFMGASRAVDINERSGRKKRLGWRVGTTVAITGADSRRPKGAFRRAAYPAVDKP